MPGPPGWASAMLRQMPECLSLPAVTMFAIALCLISGAEHAALESPCQENRQ